MTGADRLVLYILIGVGVALFFVPSGGGEPRTAVVEGAEGLRVVVSLAEDRILEVPGPLGTTVVEVREGAARVAFSPCQDKLCMRAGEVTESGDAVVCVPNGVVVRVAGREPGRTDATSR